ncbi:hypothetical protein F5I97DRAFT_2071501 [Phlebopus sp. FC_14]|nr:hypothetical protein F5I97DRAFT_2071501 [Phlebopus sp. FC_14]
MDTLASVEQTPTRPRTAPANPMLLATPQARGTASVSENISAVAWTISHPWIKRGIENSKDVSFDSMLRELLKDCRSKDTANENDELKGKLEEVLPICNQDPAIREALRQYQTNWKTSEASLYRPFVEAMNAALACLQPPDDKPQLKFVLNDTKVIKQKRQDAESKRKPDVILVPQAEPAIATSSPASKEKPGVSWHDVHTFVEFKWSRREMAKLKYVYVGTDSPDAVDQKRRYLRSDVFVSEPESQPPASTPAPEAPQPQAAGSAGHLDAPEPAEVGANSRKRASDTWDSQSQVKRAKTMERKSVVVQAGGYAAEMFAAHAGRQHVIGLIVINDLLYVWRYDRQGAIQCSAINFMLDLPRFLVLLSAMQRFDNRSWALNPNIDPEFGPRPESRTIQLANGSQKQMNVTLQLSSEERITHYGLNGRATNVFPATSDDPMYSGVIVKVFWGEKSRRSEPEILAIVEDIANGENGKGVKGHIPMLLCYEELPDTSTGEIRGCLRLDSSGERVLYVLVFRKLRPITELYGDEFLRAFWATVRCHLMLWQNGVYHRDVSPSNLMYYRDEDGNVVGVLNDFDLASTSDRATGTERTGTVPFMALDLLTKPALRGDVTHLYEHDAESFIWVLTWISLRYSNGKPLKNAELDKWLIVDAVTCREKKSDFLLQSNSLLDNKDYPPGKGHEYHLEIAQACLMSIQSIRTASLEVPRQSRVAKRTGLKKSMGAEKPETVFKKFFVDPIDNKYSRGLFWHLREDYRFLKRKCNLRPVLALAISELAAQWTPGFQPANSNPAP